MASRVVTRLSPRCNTRVKPLRGKRIMWKSTALDVVTKSLNTVGKLFTSLQYIFNERKCYGAFVSEKSSFVAQNKF